MIFLMWKIIKKQFLKKSQFLQVFKSDSTKKSNSFQWFFLVIFFYENVMDWWSRIYEQLTFCGGLDAGNLWHSDRVLRTRSICRQDGMVCRHHQHHLLLHRRLGMICHDPDLDLHCDCCLSPILVRISRWTAPLLHAVHKQFVHQVLAPSRMHLLRLRTQRTQSRVDFWRPRRTSTGHMHWMHTPDRFSERCSPGRLRIPFGLKDISSFSWTAKRKHKINREQNGW